jgi:hypothetical protein
MDEMDRIARIVPAQCSNELRIIRAELLRLADENARLLAANRDCVAHFETMQDDLDALKAKIAEAPITMLHLAQGYLPDNMRKSGLAPNTRIALVPVDD